MNILIFNVGSSSLTYKLFEVLDGDNLAVVASGKAHRVGTKGTAEAFIEHHLADQTFRETGPIADHDQAAGRISAFIREHGLRVEVIGHRIVNGGALFQEATWLDETQMARLKLCLPLSPVHNPPAYKIIQAAGLVWPAARQYATFDSAFHATMPEYVTTYALPYELGREHQYRKYGFHGPSYQDVVQKTAAFLGRPLNGLRLVACHLGTGGSSVTAIRDGQSVDTSMGYSPLPGLIMSTRTGDIDPMVPLDLIERHGYSAAQVTHLLNQESGLVGISGLSSDILDLVRAMEQGHQRARLAFEMYVHRLKGYIGAMAAVLGGLDVLVFTDDVGRRCPEVRQAACEKMAWAGIMLDPARNLQADGNHTARISADPAPVAILVVPNDEERIIGQEGIRLLRGTM